MAQNLDELIKILALLGETAGDVMPMPKSLGKGRPSGWQKNVERMLSDYNKAAANAVSDIKIGERGLQAFSGGPLEASKVSVPSVNVRTAAELPSTTVLPRAKATPKMADIMAEYIELPPEILSLIHI